MDFRQVKKFSYRWLPKVKTMALGSAWWVRILGGRFRKCL